MAGRSTGCYGLPRTLVRVFTALDRPIATDFGVSKSSSPIIRLQSLVGLSAERTVLTHASGRVNPKSPERERFTNAARFWIDDCDQYGFSEELGAYERTSLSSRSHRKCKADQQNPAETGSGITPSAPEHNHAFSACNGCTREPKHGCCSARSSIREKVAFAQNAGARIRVDWRAAKAHGSASATSIYSISAAPSLTDSEYRVRAQLLPRRWRLPRSTDHLYVGNRSQSTVETWAIGS